MSLESLRKKIDAIDEKLVPLLDARASLAKQIGKKKRKLGVQVFEPGREQSILKRVSSKSKVLGKGAIESIYSGIIAACRDIQEVAQQAAKPLLLPSAGKNLTISFLGPLGTFSHIAASSHFGKGAKLLPRVSIEDVFRSVEKGESGVGIVPVENSTEGGINSTLDQLVSSPLKITGEIKLKIEHNLLAKNGVKLPNIKTIYGHPQAFAQCKRFLYSLGAERREVASTAKACASLDSKSATIGSSLAAGLYSLSILRRNIQDRSDNTTRFVLLGKQSAARTGNDKTSIIFAVRHEPGALVRMLEIFSKRKINLTKIESRPAGQGQWEYLFYVDFEGHQKDRKCAEALAEVRKRAKFLKVLGSYPTAL